MAGYTALYDACVLYPAPLRDLLLQLAITDLFRAKWSNAIHDEWIRSVLASRPDLKIEQLQRTRDLMNRSARDALIDGFDDLIPSLELPDPDDRHVLAAAIRGRCDVIVTYNLRDFPESAVAFRYRSPAPRRIHRAPVQFTPRGGLLGREVLPHAPEGSAEVGRRVPPHHGRTAPAGTREFSEHEPRVDLVSPRAASTQRRWAVPLQ